MERPRMMKLSGIVMISIACLMCTLAVAQEPHDGESLIRAMHDRYQASWYKTVTFTQKSTTFNADGTTKVETWYEAASLPGKLRTDYAPPNDGNGIIFADGNATSMQGG